jgi:hypothetical protein
MPPWPDQVYHDKGLVCVDQGYMRCAELEMMGTAVPVALRRAGICPAALKARPRNREFVLALLSVIMDLSR